MKRVGARAFLWRIPRRKGKNSFSFPSRLDSGCLPTYFPCSKPGRSVGCLCMHSVKYVEGERKLLPLLPHIPRMPKFPFPRLIQILDVIAGGSKRRTETRGLCGCGLLLLLPPPQILWERCGLGCVPPPPLPAGKEKGREGSRKFRVGGEKTLIKGGFKEILAHSRKGAGREIGLSILPTFPPTFYRDLK